jgi:hypothetical protein
VRLAALVVGEGVVDAEGGGTEAHGVPGHRGRLALDEGKRAFEKGGDCVLLARLRLEADLQADADLGGGGGVGHRWLLREGAAVVAVTLK